MTEPWINAESWELRAQGGPRWSKLRHQTTWACRSGPLQWISRFLLELAPESEGSSSGTGSTGWALSRACLLTRFKDAGVQTLYFTPTSSLRWQFETLPRASYAFLHLFLVLHYPVTTGTLGKVWRSFAHLCFYPTAIKALKSHQYVLQRLPPTPPPPPPLSPPTPLFLPLFSSHSPSLPASRTDKQMLLRDRFHFNDYWLLISNEPLVSDQCSIPLKRRTHVCRTRLDVGNPWCSRGQKQTEWSERRQGLTLWSSGGTQQSLALPWWGAPPNLQTGRQECNNLVIPL